MTGIGRTGRASMCDDVEPTYPLILLVEVEQNTRYSRARLQEVVDATLVADALGAQWNVSRFFDRVDEFETDVGFYQVSGRIPVSPSYPIRSLGYELAAALTARLTGDLAGVAMPDFPSTAFGLDGMEAAIGVDVAADDGADPLGWPLRNMRCPEAWDLDPPSGGAKRGSGIVVGHPDTGYTYHAELLSALDLDRDYDIISGDPDAEDPLQRRWWWPFDSPGHGTSTGGAIVSAEAGAITGSAPDATLVPIRAVRSVVQVSDGDVARAIDRAVNAGVHIISMSLGGVGFYTGIRAAIERARAAGVIVMAAAGNVVRIVVAPARFGECIAVAGTDEANRPWSGSSRGDAVLISAPGHLVPVANADKNTTVEEPGTRTGISSGTSYAVAYLAGVAALWMGYHGRESLLARYGNVGLQTAFETVLTTVGFTRPDDWDDDWGVGVVDAHAVLGAALPTLDAATLASAAEPVRFTPPLQRLADLGLTAGMSRPELAAVLHCGHHEVDEVVRCHGAELSYLYAEGEFATTGYRALDSSDTGRRISPLLLSPSLRARLEQH